MMKKTMMTTTLMLLFAGATVAQDQPVRKEMKVEKRTQLHGKHLHKKHLIAELNLTDDQKERITTIRNGHKEKMEPQRKELRQLRTEIAEMKRSEQPDTKKIDAMIDRSAGMRAEMEKSRIRTEMQVEAVLTPEQKKELEAKRAERKTMRKEMRKADGPQHMRKERMHKNRELEKSAK